MKRQNIRKFTLIIALLLFPITMWYFSPAIISYAMMKHILNGSFFVFLGMLLLSPFLSRVFCSYFCPAAGLQECLMQVNNKPSKLGRRKYIKFVIWIVWIFALVFLFCTSEGIVKADFFFETYYGISIYEISHYTVYYGVIAILAVPALIHGRRSTCHYICWMAPFMIIGSKIGQLLHLPQLHIKAEKDKCISCKKCNQVCPMSLDVVKMVHEQGNCINMECIQCGACIDNCPKGVLKYSMKIVK